jgi:hypothetical protein
MELIYMENKSDCLGFRADGGFESQQEFMHQPVLGAST